MSTQSSPSSQMYSSPTPSVSEERVAAPIYAQPPRKMASTGGGRAWSEEEENYLIETRQHKMPYKHIAAHLQKTELACRLHYHQLSFGTKRRRRTSSISSNRSLSSNPSLPGDAMSITQRPLPQLSPPTSPENNAQRMRSVSPHAAAGAVPAGAPVPILPKPNQTSSRQQQHQHFSSTNALRLITSDVDRPFDGPARTHQRVGSGSSGVDKIRLARAYDIHRNQFWAAVAREYGEGIQPAVVEDVWWRGYAAQFPPTPPTRSPSSPKLHLASKLPAPALVALPPTAGFAAVNVQLSMARNHSAALLPPSRSNSSFAIASLLTEDKEILSTPKVQAVALAH